MWTVNRVKSAARRSFWLRLLIPLAVSGSLAVTTVVAIFPGRAAPAVVGLMAGLGPQLYRFRMALRLRKRERVLYYDVLCSGQACAEPRVNELVREELASAVTLGSGRRWTPRANRIAFAVIATIPVLAALVATALRSPWWLLEGLAAPPLFSSGPHCPPVMHWRGWSGYWPPWARLTETTLGRPAVRG